MSMVATAEPDNVPPRVRLEIETDDPGDTFLTLNVTRNGVATRVQPPVGDNESVVLDTDAPYQVPLTYEAIGTVLPAVAATWTENWASLASWTGGTESWSVAGGKATSSGSGLIVRTSAVPIERLRVDDMQNLNLTLLNASNQGVLVLKIAKDSSFGPGGSTYFIRLQLWDGSEHLLDTTTVPATFTTPDPFPAFVMALVDGTVTVSSEDGSWSLTGAYTGTPTKVQLGRDAVFIGLGNHSVKQIINYPAVTPEDFSATAETELDVGTAWLIHPTSPDLSLEIDAGPDGPCCGPGCAADDDTVIYLDPESEDTVVYASSTTVHDVVGSSKPIPVSSGRRKAGVWTMYLQTCNLVARDAILAILDDQQPLLLQLPASLNYDLPNGWYDIGDVAESRLAADLTKPQRRISLPMQPVAEPSELAAFGHTWAELLTEGLTWQGVLDTYGTWLNVLTGDPV